MKTEKENFNENGGGMDRGDEERDRDRRGRRERQSRFSGGGDRDRSPRGKKRGNRVLVSNIPYEYRWQELKDLFREQVGEVSFVELFVDENDKARGVGIIEFASSEMAKEAVEKMHRYDLKGRKLVVKEDDSDRDKYGRIIPRGGDRGGRRDMERGGGGNWNDIPSLVNGPPGSNSKWGNTYGLSSQFLESLNINGPLVPRCFVANLDYKVDDKKLKEVFRLAGRVISAEISLDKEGKSRGFGVVEYEHPVEAVQAISMLNNQMLYERRLSVRMDRVDKNDGLPPKLPEGLKGIGMGLGANGVPLQDVARNLPNSQPSSMPPPVPALSAVNNPALAAAALVGNLIGAQGGGSGDITSLAANSLGLNTAAALTGGANPLAAQLLGAGNINPFGGNSGGGRDFDSLGAALTGGSGFNQGGSSGGLAAQRDNRNLGGNTGSIGGGWQSDTIIISNLPPGTTGKILMEKCRDVGDVKFAEMRGKETGIVQFTNQWVAQRGINMLDGMRVDGRIIEVRFF
ncbi:myelin expression factor 2 isoform X2 [Cimex lectularius]|uniref:RRM domain-containing protein n=1 Tax=Cimex lectularius TaxID=79782 RepID=A0A8I6RX37_CIMLE|nr:myelin expression factor 2 isoform X2 [Cimex lectularius]